MSIGLFLLALAAPAALDGAVSDYPSAYFAPSQPSSALDMVSLTPGFTLDVGDGSRGLESAAGNVLIDGVRPASKDDTLDRMLARIPASSIARIEVIRGGAPGIDMHGRSVVANIIRRRDESQSLTVTATGTHGTDDEMSGNLLIDAERRKDGRRFEVSVQFAKQLDIVTGAGDGSWRRYDGQGNLIFSANEHLRSANQVIRTTTELETPAAGGKLNLNLSAQVQPYVERQVDLFAAPARQELSKLTQQQNNLELGLRFERPAPFGLASETYGLQRFGRLINPVDFLSDPATASLTGDDRSNRFSLVEETRESVVRQSFSRQLRPDLSIKFGLEGADNYLKSRTLFTENGADVALPAANVAVSETRGEAFATASWKASSRLMVEAAFREETSHISSTGDVVSGRSLTYAKPRVSLTWTQSPKDQFRARLEREVGQLDFASFVASTGGINTGTVKVGNPTLNPTRDWVGAIAWDHHFWKSAVLSLAYSHTAYDEIVDVVGVISPSGEYSAPGDIRSATKEEEDVVLTLPTDRFGLPKGTLSAQAAFRQTRVTDPTTGAGRSISQTHPSDWEIHYNQGLPQWKASFDIDINSPQSQPAFYFNEIDQTKSFTMITVSAEWKPSPDLALTFQVLNPLEHTFFLGREVFTGPRNVSSIAFIDQRHDTTKPLLKVKLVRLFQ